MAADEGGREEEFVYRISSAEEWEEFQKSGSTFGGLLDKSSAFIHLSNLSQVPSPQFSSLSLFFFFFFFFFFFLGIALITSKYR